MTNEEALIVLETQLTNMHGEYASIEMPPIIKELYDALEIAVDAIKNSNRYVKATLYAKDFHCPALLDKRSMRIYTNSMSYIVAEKLGYTLGKRKEVEE